VAVSDVPTHTTVGVLCGGGGFLRRNNRQVPRVSLGPDAGSRYIGCVLSARGSQRYNESCELIVVLALCLFLLVGLSFFYFVPLETIHVWTGSPLTPSPTGHW